uniref:Ig-like domain-containing protein n=1 Tax=Timema bartmani TaxID=61472 RepID=A0A7R9EVE5_9NEOP|nr:unnamed protein product [Timema bartmani]
MSRDGNITTSTLTFVPSMEDSGKILTCRAETLLIPDSSMEDGWSLNIYHVPIVNLELGSNLNATTIREGVDVYFDCSIKSNPWVYKVSWRHNGKMLFNNASTGTIVSNQSLVLQSVTRARAGIYTCVGSNHEGDGESNPVVLDVKFHPTDIRTSISPSLVVELNTTSALANYATEFMSCELARKRIFPQVSKLGVRERLRREDSFGLVVSICHYKAPRFFKLLAPVCRPGQQRVHGVARQETARVMCEVDANPSEVHFIWKFNNSAEMVDIQASHFTTDRTRSVASYVPMTELDYGTLLCWGRNELGLQKEPCVFQVIPAAVTLAKPSVEGLKLAKGAQQNPSKRPGVVFLLSKRLEDELTNGIPSKIKKLKIPPAWQREWQEAFCTEFKSD